MADDVRLQELVQRCSGSRPTRQRRYSWLRTWYTRGSDSLNVPARYNKLESHIELLTSYLYAPESSRFYLSIPPRVRANFLDHAEIARDEYHRVWHDTKADVMFSEMVTWANVYSAAIAKVNVVGRRGQTVVQNVSPSDFGVLREDLMTCDEQEVMVHFFYATEGQIRALVENHPKRDLIVKWALENMSPRREGAAYMPPMMQQIVTNAVGGTFPNQTVSGVTNFSSLGEERPDVEEPLCELAEVWEKDRFVADYPDIKRHRFDDYWVTTMIGSYAVMERRNPVLPYVHIPHGIDLPAEQPFVAVVPRQLLDYFWGKSALLGLIQLQAWREGRMVQLDKLYEQQLDPARFFSGVSLPEERLRALRTPGGTASSINPQAKVETFKPDMPQNPFEMLHEIDSMFSDEAGLPDILQGDNQQGVRAGNQVGALATIAGGRVRKRALIVEDALEAVATRQFHLMQRHDDTTYGLPDGRQFLLSQLPPQTIVKVSAHSASPIYQDQTKQDAMMLQQAGAIDLPTFVELVNPPMMELLRDKAKLLAQGQAQMAQKKMQIEMAKATKGHKK